MQEAGPTRKRALETRLQLLHSKEQEREREQQPLVGEQRRLKQRIRSMPQSLK
jgi:hypothetical protein